MVLLISMARHKLNKLELRYSRELINVNEQEKIERSHILMAGCGAGSILAPILARLGYATKGQLILADPDVVEDVNLNRQAYDERHLGVNKAEALASIIKEKNSNVRTCVIREGVTLENVYKLVSLSDIIVDMIDISRPEIMALLHRTSQKQKKIIITGFDIGWGCAAYIFDYRNSRSMSVDNFLGTEDFLIEDFKDLNGINIASQFILGPLRTYIKEIHPSKSLVTIQDRKNYYKHFFDSRENRDNLKERLPSEMHNFADDIFKCNVNHIPQTNIATNLLASVEQKVIHDVIVEKHVLAVPEYYALNISQMLRQP